MFIVSLGDIRRRDRQTPVQAEYVGKYESALNGTIDKRVIYHTQSGPGFYLQLERCWDEKHPGPPYKKDGPFLKTTSFAPWYSMSETVKKRFPRGANPKSYFEYAGSFNLTSMTFAGSGFTSNDFSSHGAEGAYDEDYADGSEYGPEAWNKARPEIQKADGAVFTGEAREIPGMLGGSAKFFRDTWKSMGGDMTSPFMQPKRVADEFLNQQFGWRPFLGDLSKFHDTFVNTDKYLNQIWRDNNQWIRRRRTLFRKLSEPNHYSRTYAPLTSPYFDLSHLLTPRMVDGKSCRGLTDFYHQSFDSVWFSAFFRYYLSQFDSGKRWFNTPYGEVNRLLTLYGFRISPSVLWNLTPWTWLADWVSNAGDNIDNLSAMTIDNLVARNACIMRRRSESFTAIVKVFWPERDISFNTTFYVMTKSRRTASPFGFDLDWGDFSLRQLAILGALGISRAST